jgi:hypothetical protein
MQIFIILGIYLHYPKNPPGLKLQSLASGLYNQLLQPSANPRTASLNLTQNPNTQELQNEEVKEFVVD